MIDYAVYQAACQRADAQMKEKQGHSFITILKTRCQYCGRSRAQAARGKCRGWFMTFIDLLYHELNASTASVSLNETPATSGDDGQETST